MLERMRAGRFKSRNTLDDALTVAVVETGVAMRGFDADRIQGDLGLRVSQPGEKLGGDGLELPEGTIVIADERHAVALIFGDTAPEPRSLGGHDADRALRDPGGRAFRTSASRRPCGFAATSSPAPDVSRPAGPGWAPGPLVDLRRRFGRERNPCLSLRRAKSETDGQHWTSLLRTDVDEAAARRSLREQIAHLERELSALFTAAHPRRDLEWQVRAPGGPRLLGIGELEALRDDLAARLEDTRRDPA